ncbi:MAG: helix-turn-helix transcriptional regulator [Deltaproteobacteria bacterium]|nr:helix-turn-helix transcriptional regulator [Deltaproteobacteria bacterium]
MTTSSDPRAHRRKDRIAARARFGKNLEGCRRQRQLTQAALAQRLGVDRSLVARWERGQRDPDLAILERVASALKVPMSRLARGVERLPPSEAVLRIELSALGVPISTDWSSPPWALRPVETTLAEALERTDPRIVDALPGVLATTTFRPRVLWAKASERALTERRLGWLTGLAQTLIARGVGYGGAHLEELARLVQLPGTGAAWDDVGKSASDRRKLPPISKRWRVSYDQTLRGFMAAAEALTEPAL